MIKYLLKCKNKHEFESWFSDSIEYEKLKKKNLIKCIFCKSQEVDKSIMSPGIIGKVNAEHDAFNNKEFTKTKKDLIKLKRFVEKNFKFVGDKFPQEIREIYYGNKENKNIYGITSSEERQELEEEGIEFNSIPWTRNKEN